MSSGSLPLATYHRAEQLGAGTYGTVVTVYNEDGEEFALKLFLPEEGEATNVLDIGALREISCLRLFRGENRHENIVELVDIQSEWIDDEDQAGAGTAGYWGMTLPLFRSGSLASALVENGFLSLSSTPKRIKAKIAHGILSAVAFLHDNGVLHRDIKSDNILLEYDSDDASYKAVLIDFSLAKPIDDTMFAGGIIAKESRLLLEKVRHTGSVGTITYTAPEIIEGLPYGKKSDLWSVGVVLLELLLGRTLDAVKHKQANLHIRTAMANLPSNQPFPDLIRGLLEQDPEERLSSRQSLEQAFFAKFDLQAPPARYVSTAAALPLESAASLRVLKEFSQNQTSTAFKATKLSAPLQRRLEKMERSCRHLESQNPLTLQSAFQYSRELEQLEDPLEENSLLDCVVLAFRFWEVAVLDLHELDEVQTGPFAQWSLQEYVDKEATLFTLLDYCLYPR